MFDDWSVNSISLKDSSTFIYLNKMEIIFPNKWHFDDFAYVLSFTKNFLFKQLAQNHQV